MSAGAGQFGRIESGPAGPTINQTSIDLALEKYGFSVHEIYRSTESDPGISGDASCKRGTTASSSASQASTRRLLAPPSEYP